MAKRSIGLNFLPLWIQRAEDPFKRFKWHKVDSKIVDFKGQEIFSQAKVEAPIGWSQLAVDIAASKYLRQKGVPKSRGGRETSVKQMISRVVDTITEFGLKNHYFKDRNSAKAFRQDLTFLCLSQMAAFNSPVWFNCGLYQKYKIRGAQSLWRYDVRKKKVVKTNSAYEFPQTSACFILSLQDDLGSIFELAKTETSIFKFGSGAGTNFSNLRGKNEPLESGGKSSGVLAFLDVLDRGAGATKSGGTTRRAAKMVTLDVDHPEIREFIQWKAHEEDKAEALIKAGYSGGLDGEAYRTVSGQNANHSVRVNDRFLKQVDKNGEWWTTARTTGKRLERFSAKELWSEIAQAAWRAADPGLQFHDTINRWHTCPSEGEIRASNPCSEYMFVDDSACNLASLNLVKFLKADGSFDVEGFKHAVRILITAQEILVEMSAYPTPQIAWNSARLRPLGLGYANLGGLLMRRGLSYDSDEGRNLAAQITSLLSGQAYLTSAELARCKGSFLAFKRNRTSMLKVIKKHRGAARKIKSDASALSTQAQSIWSQVLNLGTRYGFRNAQVSVLAPTGTIGLLMDCETTGIEPDFALRKTKKMVGGGEIVLLNHAVEPSLKRLGYKEEDIKDMVKALKQTGAIEDHPLLKEQHRAIFDCAQANKPKGRVLSPQAHLLMMASVQPFLSGAISKTVNLPAEATVKDVEQVYWHSWKLGLKAIAIYRDTSKGAQPLTQGPPPPTCSQCGRETVRSGNCFKCLYCGHSESCG